MNTTPIGIVHEQRPLSLLIHSHSSHLFVLLYDNLRIRHFLSTSSVDSSSLSMRQTQIFHIPSKNSFSSLVNAPIKKSIRDARSQAAARREFLPKNSRLWWYWKSSRWIESYPNQVLHNLTISMRPLSDAHHAAPTSVIPVPGDDFDAVSCAPPGFADIPLLPTLGTAWQFQRDLQKLLRP